MLVLFQVFSRGDIYYCNKKFFWIFELSIFQINYGNTLVHVARLYQNIEISLWNNIKSNKQATMKSFLHFWNEFW